MYMYNYCKLRIRQPPIQITSLSALLFSLITRKQRYPSFTSYRFRARPINEKIFKSAYCGLPKKDQKEPTVAISPKFATTQRVQQHKEESTMHTSFHARPIPRGMLSGCTVCTNFFVSPLAFMYMFKCAAFRPHYIGFYWYLLDSIDTHWIQLVHIEFYWYTLNSIGT